MKQHRRFVEPRRWGSFLTAAGLLAMWEWLGGQFGSNEIVPRLSAIGRQVAADGWGFYSGNLRSTMQAAAVGFVLGNLSAIGLATFFIQFPRTEKVLMRLAVMTYAIPIVAVGPLLQVVLSGDMPKIALATFTVFFTTLVGCLLGLRSADPLAIDLIRSLGGGRAQQLRLVRFRYALPSLFGALQIAAPLAVLGAVVAEYFGSRSGIGVAMVSAQETLQIERTWALAGLITVTSLTLYGVVGGSARWLLPRASGTELRR